MGNLGDSRSLLSWVHDSRVLHERWRVRATLHEYYKKGNWDSYVSKMNTALNTTTENVFVWALIDSPEIYRRLVLEELENKFPEIYKEIVSLISEIQEEDRSQEGRSVPGIAFQCVALPDYLSTLPKSARQCVRCRREFDEGADIIWMRCREHPWCSKCFEERSSESLKPPFLDCPCADPDIFRYR